MQIKVTKCDTCGETIAPDSGMRVLTPAKAEDEGDFCNKACLSEWLDKRVAAMPGANEDAACAPCSICGLPLTGTFYVELIISPEGRPNRRVRCVVNHSQVATMLNFAQVTK